MRTNECDYNTGQWRVIIFFRLLTGQFQYKPIHMLNPLVGHSANGHIKGILNVDGHKKNVFKMKEAIDQTYDCWWSLPETYIDGETEQYFLADYFSRFNTISV